MKRLNNPQELEKIRKQILALRDPEKPCIAITSGTSARAYGSEKVVDAFRAKIKRRGLTKKIDIRVTGGQGFDEREPLVIIHPKDLLYQRVGPEDVEEIITETLLKDKIIDRLLYTHPQTGEKIVDKDEIPFYKGQMPIVFGNNAKIDPTSVEDYIAIGGYCALSKVLAEFSPVEVIDTVKRSGLRGRGGAGFPTGVKWESCRNTPADKHYVICNADEGDPGAYMDRGLLEGNPHSVLEGMMIGAYAIGSEEGYIYIRNEYPLAVKHFRVALEQAREWGFLGHNILGSDLSFDIELTRGAGAFVCGEETGLMASIEGRTGEPRPRPPYPAQKGLWGRPANINNVETWANVPLIINRGVDWYTSIGTETSKGTKIFSLVGKVNNTGLVEVPMGMSIREIVYDIGGGIPEGKKFKAVQTGGPSGGCIPASLIDLRIDYEELADVGSIMGSGGMIVTDENTCMVDTAKYFLSFTKEESCGKCTPCREGIYRMHHILSEITVGRGKEDDIDLLKELADYVSKASLCALGGTAPNPVLTTIRYFRDEYEAHIKDKKCPAGVCKALIQYYIDPEKCNGCHLCLKLCPQAAIYGEAKAPHSIDREKCSKCGICLESCKFEAVILR